MTINDIPQLRLINQQITGSTFTQPSGLLNYMAGMQAQDYGQAKWALGSRLPGSTDAFMEQAIANKEVVRTWLMRGTIHLAAAADVRWLLTLLGPRLIAAFAIRDQQLKLDAATVTRCNSILTRALKGGNQLTREELAAALAYNGIIAEGQRLSHILYRAGFDQLICFGVKRGNSFTYTLLDEWLPDSKILPHEEALAELTRRYFTSRGPATLTDFTGWSGLSMSEAKAGLEIIKGDLYQEVIADQTYWHVPVETGINKDASATYLLAGFDEYILGYKDRSACLEPQYNKHVMLPNGIFNPVIVLDGQIVGTWKRTLKKDTVEIQTYPFHPLPETCHNSIIASARAYAGFVGKGLILNGNFLD